jgi:hypothetical protein
VVDETVVEHDGEAFQLCRDGRSLYISDEEQTEVERYASASENGLVVNLTPGSQTYFEARAYHGQPFKDCDLVGAVVVAALGGHPDADEARRGTQLSAVWSHHLAIVGGEEPRYVAKTYAPTETRVISGDVQNIAVSGVVVRCGKK